MCGFEVWQWVVALVVLGVTAIAAGVFGALWVRGEKIERAIS